MDIEKSYIHVINAPAHGNNKYIMKQKEFKINYKKVKLEKFTIRFQTNLNASMMITIKAKSYKKAIEKILKQFPDAFDFN
jgi:hypothetical protein